MNWSYSVEFNKSEIICEKLLRLNCSTNKQFRFALFNIIVGLAKRLDKALSDCYPDTEGRRRQKWKHWNWETLGQKGLQNKVSSQRTVIELCNFMLEDTEDYKAKRSDKAIPIIHNQILFEAYIYAFKKYLSEMTIIEESEKQFIRSQISRIKDLARHNKFFFGQSEGIYSLLKYIFSIYNKNTTNYKKGYDITYDNLLYILENESNDLFAALIDAYSFHCEPKIVRRYLQILPKIIHTLETNKTKRNHLIVLKHFLYLYKGLLIYENPPYGDFCKLKLDYFDINTIRSEEVKFSKTDSEIPPYIPYDFSFKSNAVCFKTIFKLVPTDAVYSVLLTLKDEKHQINVVFTHKKFKNPIEYIK